MKDRPDAAGVVMATCVVVGALVGFGLTGEPDIGPAIGTALGAALGWLIVSSRAGSHPHRA